MSSNMDEAVKIWKALQPMVEKVIETKTRSCVRSRKMTVTTEPNGSVIGVKGPFQENEILIPYSSAVANAIVGNAVWVQWFFDNASTMIAVSYGGGTDSGVDKKIFGFTTPQEYGAKADGTTDDTQAVQAAIDSGLLVFFPDGVYRIAKSYTVTLPAKGSVPARTVSYALTSGSGFHMQLDNGAVLSLDTASNIDCFLMLTNGFNNDPHDYNSVLSGGTVQGNYKCDTLIGLHGYRHLKMDHVRLQNFLSVGLDTAFGRENKGTDCGEGVFSGLLIQNSEYKAGSMGIYDSHDNMFNSVIVQDVPMGFNCGASSYVNCHYWVSYHQYDIFDHSVAFSIRTEALLQNSVVDTCRTAFHFGPIANAVIDNANIIHNNAVIEEAHANSVGIILFDPESGSAAQVSNFNCLLYSGYTNVKMLSDTAVALSAGAFTLSLVNDRYLVKPQNYQPRSITSSQQDFCAYKINYDSSTDTYVFPVPRRVANTRQFFLVYGAPGNAEAFMFLGSITANGQSVAFTPIVNSANVTLSGAYDETNLTITASGDLTGGIRLIWQN